MGKENRFDILKKRVLRSSGLFVAVAILLMSPVQPAYAQYTVTSVGGVDYTELLATYAADAAQWLSQNAQSAYASVTNSAGQLLTAQANTLNTDTIDANARVNDDVEVAQNLTTSYLRPSTYSWCHVAESAATADNDGIGAMSQALTQGSQNFQLTDPAVHTKYLKTEMALGFAPCSNPADPEYSAWKSLGCTQVDGGQHERQDRNIETLLDPYQYLVDPAFQKPQKTGVYTPMTAVSAEKYYPFVAALTLCQHITPVQPPPPKQTGTTPTLSALAVGRRMGAETTISAAPSACYDALEKRMQFDNTTNFPAGNARTDVTPPVLTRHDEQARRCTEENAAGYLDDSLNAACQVNGRSTLQADHDMAYRLEMANYQIKVLATMPTATEALMVAMAQEAQLKFQDRLHEERAALVSAIEAAGHASTVYTSNLDVPVQQ